MSAKSMQETYCQGEDALIVRSSDFEGEFWHFEVPHGEGQPELYSMVYRQRWSQGDRDKARRVSIPPRLVAPLPRLAS